MITKFSTAVAALALASSAAYAADLPRRTTPPVYVPPPIAAFSWTGFEFGLTTSYAFTDSQRVFTTANGGATPRNGFISVNKDGTDYVGAGAGYNYQFTPGSGVVAGVMLDGSYLDNRKNAFLFTPDGAGGNDLSIYHQRLTYLATINGRIGYAFDHFLVYGTGGFAFGDVHYATSHFTGLGGAPTYAGSVSDTATGYDYGGGIEYAIPADSILNYLSVEKLLGIDKAIGLDTSTGVLRAEYVHYNLGSRSVTATGTGVGSYVSRFRTDGNLVRVGLGYKFGGDAAPVVARY